MVAHRFGAWYTRCKYYFLKRLTPFDMTEHLGRVGEMHYLRSSNSGLEYVMERRGNEGRGCLLLPR